MMLRTLYTAENSGKHKGNSIDVDEENNSLVSHMINVDSQ